MSDKAKLCILLPGIIALGFLRDYLFINVNWVTLTMTTGRRLQARHEFYFLLDWPQNQLIILKWLLTFIFFFLFLAVTRWIIQVLYKNRFYNQITIIVFLGIMGISGVLYIIGLLSPTLYDNFYGTIINLMHLTQSFIPLLILIIVFKFLPDSQND